MTAPIYRFHLGVIDVIELGVNDTLCIYSTTAEPHAGADHRGARLRLVEIQRLSEAAAKE